MNLLELLNGVRYGRYDKTVHFLLSALITLGLVLVLPVWAGAAVALCLGVAKECYDWRWRRSRFDPGDLLVDLVGIGAALIVVYLV